MTRAVFLKAPGGVEQLEWREAHLQAPRPGEALIRHNAVGVNFIDIYQRTGLYALPSYPAVLGKEGAGVVEEVGEGVNLKPGQRVAYVTNGAGAYAERRIISADLLVPLPDEISDEVAAASMLKGMTAEYLLTRSFPVQKGDSILIHAAAGGVGLIVCQWAKHLGATVIGTVGSDAKAQLARKAGADHVIMYNQEKVSSRVRELTKGRGVDVVYDSVGKDTFMDSLDALRPLGMMVSFGQSSGKVPPFDVGVLSQKGSLFLTRPTLFHYVSETSEYQRSARAFFDLVREKNIHIRIDRTLPLSEAAQAHRLLESRATSGAVVLTA